MKKQVKHAGKFIKTFLIMFLCIAIIQIPIGNVKAAETRVNLENMLINASSAIGRTLYVWGGGWNEADDGSGETTFYNGFYPGWENFYNANKSGYSFEPGEALWDAGDRSARFNGLDCSGFMGWVLYNGVVSGHDPKGYVYSSRKVADSYAGLGLGSVKDSTPDDTFRAGDILSLKSAGHVVLVLGQCADGSVLILHSTPEGGVQVSGTAKGKALSIASETARIFMQTNYPDWWAHFGSQGRQRVDADTYLNCRHFTFNDSVLSDSKGLRNMSAEEMLNAIVNNKVKEPENINKVLRVFNPKTGEHHFTLSELERITLCLKGWNNEGVAWISGKTGEPVYRLFNPKSGEHFYTISKAEKDDLSVTGWNYEGIGWNSNGNTPVYRLFDPKATAFPHHYTKSEQEREDLINKGWNDEGIGWYCE